jgi:D-amino-acid dehydrogenase
MKTAIVLGAGMVGVSTALALADRGWAVVLVDRKAPGLETSFGNAGIIQAEAVEPYAMPRSPVALFDIATGRSNDVVYSVRELPHHLGALMRYWWHSESGRHRAASVSWGRLIGQATQAHEPLIRRAGADNLIRKAGFSMLYRSGRALETDVRDAERKARDYGIHFRARSSTEMLQAEPALRTGGAGGIHWQDSWTVSDPGGLVASYAELLRRTGGRIAVGDAASLAQKGAGWSVMTSDGPIEASDVVLALGPWSPELLRRFGHDIPMVRKRGYHAHYRSPVALNAPVMDHERGYLLLPMAAGTRITTGAHLARAEVAADYRQLARAEAAVVDLYDLGARIEDKPWQGTRPCMPDMLPVIGASPRQRGFWLNFGHGHQGFTLGPASAAMLAAMMDGEAPGIDMAPFSATRF